MKSIVSTIIYQFSDKKKKVIDHRKHSMIAAAFVLFYIKTQNQNLIYIYSLP